MGKLLYTYPILAVALLFFLCSCTKEKGDMPQQNDETKFVLATKAGAGSELTFRIMAYGCEPDNHFSHISTGTYSNLGKEFDGFPHLTASELDDDGEFIKEDVTKALAVPYNQIGKHFFITYISPGITHADGGFTVDYSTPFYSSDVQKTVLNNYGKVEMTKDLIDRRAKIGFRIYKDKAEKTVQITDFGIVGTGNIYWPATKQVTPNDTIDVTLAAVPENSERQIYECSEFNYMPFILSGIYAPKDTVAAHIFKNTADYALDFIPTNLQESEYLMAKFKLSINGSGPLEMEVPLTFNPLTNKALEILPLTTYMYNITVSKTYISTILEVTPLNSWEDIEFGFEIKDNTVMIDLGSFEFSAWKDVEWEDNKDIDDSANN